MYIIYKKIWFELCGKVIHLSPSKSKRGSVLLSYTTLPFLIKESLINGHTNRFECREMAKIFTERGFEVDVIDWDNKNYIPNKKYNYFVDIHDNLEYYSPRLNKDCKKILHLTTSDWRFQNDAEMYRIKKLKERRGFLLKPRRQLTPTNSAEIADYIILLGNGTTKSTYNYIKTPITTIPLSNTHFYPSPINKDYSKIKRNFIWLGGSGMVHKGLDLVLEAFSKMPDCSLSIFGNVEAEDDFATAYSKEIYHTPNIKMFGKIDTGSKTFLDVISSSVASVYFSCSEGQSGAVVTTLHAGLIPIISTNTGVDCPGFGIILKDVTVESIIESVKAITEKSDQDLKEESVKAWNYARSHHTKESFSKSYKNFIESIDTQKNNE